MTAPLTRDAQIEAAMQAAPFTSPRPLKGKGNQ